MKLKFTIIVSVGLLFMLNLLTFSQEKWSLEPQKTAIYATGQYQNLPQKYERFEPFVKGQRVYHTPGGTLLVSPTFRVHPDPNATQSECQLVRNQQIPNIMFGSANTVWPPGGFSGISEGVYLTTDGGSTWFGWDSVHSNPIAGHGGDDGPCIDKNGTLIISHLGYPQNGMFANYSTDMGVTFSATYTITSLTADKNFSSSDDAPSSPYYGRTYTVWTNWNGVYPIVVSYTTNGGVSWSAMAQINTPVSGHMCQGCDVRCGPNGEVYVVWAAPTLAGQIEDFEGFAKSTDGGVTWTVTDNAFDANGIRGFLPTKGNIRVNSFPRIDVDRSGGPRNGWIYIVGCDKNLSPAGSDPDIILHKSTNGGVSWSAAVRVNQDALNNGAIQWFPAIRVDEYGAVNVTYYDDRNVFSNLAQVYLSRSVDGGVTWTDIQVSDHNFAPAPISGLAGGYAGDYIGICSANNKLYPFWMDNSVGNNLYQIWTVGIQAVVLPHDIAMGPFLSYPGYFLAGNTYSIKGKVSNVGTLAETNIPVKWYINNVLTNTNTITSLAAGQSDSATNSWLVPTTVGTYNLKYISALSTDTNHLNDTIQANVVIAHDIAMGPFVNFPGVFIINTAYSITGQVHNVGNFNETGVPINFYINGTLTSTRSKNLNGNQIDTVNNVWTPTVAGTYNLKYISALSTDLNHTNDTLQQTVLVYASLPQMCPFACQAPTTYTAISGSPGPTGDDVGMTVPLGFTFSYKTHLFTQGWICTNGFMQLGPTGTTAYLNDLSVVADTNLIAGFWDDLNTFNGGNIQYATIGTAPNRIFICQFTNVAYYSGTGNVTFQIRLHESTSGDGTVEIIYGPATNNASATGSIGITVPPGGSGNFTSITPGSSGCSNTTYSTTTANNSLPYTNLPSGTYYVFCPLVGIHQEQNTVPTVYALLQNYPNPFNPATSIKYSIPKTSLVKLVVYDLLGREVKTLVNGMKTPGYYEEAFDGTNLASGIYFYRIEAGKFTDVKKMVLVK
jgi:hypothetical protein